MAEITKFDITEGWLGWIDSPPRTYLGGDNYPIEIMRQSWDKPVVIYAKDLHPEFNVAGLYWRATGIYKHFMSEVRPGIQQMNACGGLGSLMAGMLGSSAYSGPVDFTFWPDGSVSGNRSR